MENEISVSTVCNGKHYNIKIGDKFNHLTIVRLYRDFSGDYKRWFCDCVCDCGGKLFNDKKGIVNHIELRRVVRGNDVSCGCVNKANIINRNTKHNKSLNGKLVDSQDKSIYKEWIEMRRRVYGTDNTRDITYAIKNIKCCSEWDSYLNFYTLAMENGYKEGLTLDRMDNSSDYCPSNCRWVTQSENSKNTDGVIMVKYRGKVHIGSNLFKSLGIDKKTIREHCKKISNNLYECDL